MNTVMNVIVTKMCNNIKYWNDEEVHLNEHALELLAAPRTPCQHTLMWNKASILCHFDDATGAHFNITTSSTAIWSLQEILAQTLEVFSDLVSTYASCKALLALDTVRFLVYNHTGDHFPFLVRVHEESNVCPEKFLSCRATRTITNIESISTRLLVDWFSHPQKISITRLTASSNQT
jgi:hypothetical protein